MGSILPSFLGYFTARSGIMASQVAMDTINHNISNVNTPGYSQQEVDLQTAYPYPPPNLPNGNITGQIGQGVAVQGISRSHSNYLDGQIRDQNSLYGMASTLQSNMQSIEGILGEPGSQGADTAMTNFFSAAQALSVHPDDIATRTSFMQSAQNMLQTFQQEATSLQSLRTNLVGDPNSPGTFATTQAASTVADINSKLQQIANLNSQILNVSSSGATPNDLLDQRDQLLSELSKEINITVSYRDPGQADVQLGNNYLVRGGTVQDTLNAVQNTSAAPGPDNNPTLIELNSTGASMNGTITGGSLGGILQIGGNAANQTTIRGVLGSLDTLFGQLATSVNAIQATGRDYYGNIPIAANQNIFNLAAGPGLNIFNYSINSNLVTDPKLVAAAIDDAGTFDGVADGRNALAMADVANTSYAALGNVTVHDYYNQALTSLGVNTQSIGNEATNYNSALQQLQKTQQSTQGVSLEEQMVSLLQYQRSFEASAKVMSTMDSVMDTLINKMVN